VPRPTGTAGWTGRVACSDASFEKARRCAFKSANASKLAGASPVAREQSVALSRLPFAPRSAPRVRSASLIRRAFTDATSSAGAHRRVSYYSHRRVGVWRRQWISRPTFSRSAAGPQRRSNRIIEGSLHATLFFCDLAVAPFVAKVFLSPGRNLSCPVRLERQVGRVGSPAQIPPSRRLVVSPSGLRASKPAGASPVAREQSVALSRLPFAPRSAPRVPSASLIRRAFTDADLSADAHRRIS
jgi:hypothetical protein